MIRLLTIDDAQAYVTLRHEALLYSPLAFASSPDDDRASSVDETREMLRGGPDSVIFGAFADRLVGTAGMYRDRHVKAAHKVHLWGMYVAPDHRRRGHAAGLIDAVIRHARTVAGVSWIHLAVSSAAPEARRLYERAGFKVWGTEPDALRHNGRTVDEYHMALRLK